MEKKYLKNQKGFAATDALIAIIIITLFTGLIATIAYNIYITNASIKRIAQSTEYITDIFEYTDKIYYDEVTAGDIGNTMDLVAYFNDKYNSNNNGKAMAKTTQWTDDDQENNPYKVKINVVKYTDTEGNEDKLDLLKIVTVSVSYKLGKRDQTIEMSKIKKRENLIIPNSPELGVISINPQTERVFPIKYINNKWQVTDENDTTWYNYENGYWAVALRTTENLTIGDEITMLGNETNIYAWIPRYAYNNSDETDVKLIYSTSNNSVITDANGYNLLDGINEEDYDITLFTDANGDTQNELRGRWITLGEMQDQIVSVFNIFNNSKYEIKNLEI